ncbi:unnamed protein product [Parnassius apollo]|uniref:(apollo) hypothetical protein n=1 Tax=Parnassius apollo TaxID=110799 RepID=A0A8S3WKH6_PARAO|nr:unnamed protein product [Parnassius apollo]
MENIFEVLKTQVTLEKTLNQRLDEFEARLEGSSKDLSLKDLSSDYINFKDFVYSTFTLLRQKINNLVVNVDAIESRHRKKFLLLGGVVENTNENVRELVASVITKNLGSKIVPFFIKNSILTTRKCDIALRIEKTSFPGNNVKYIE